MIIGRRFALSIILIIVSLISTAQTIMNVDTFRDEFNSLSDNLRVIITNDPDCGGCLYMVQQEMAVIEDPASCGLNDGIRYMFNWTKVLGGTTMAAATGHTATWSHPRFIHYWDETQILGDLLLTTLGLVDPSASGEYTAWHTAVCYESGVEWNQSDQYPPTPTFWIHKLNENYNADQSLYYSDSLFQAGLSALACLMTVEDESLNERVIIRGSGSGQVAFDFLNVESNGQLLIRSIDGRTAITYPIDGKQSIQTPPQLRSGTYLLTLIEGGSVTGTSKFVLVK